MPVHNSEIASILRELADLLDIEEANAFRVRAYRSAAQTIGNLPRSAADMLDEGEAGLAEDHVPFIGEGDAALHGEQALAGRALTELDLLMLDLLGPA